MTPATFDAPERAIASGVAPAASTACWVPCWCAAARSPPMKCTSRSSIHGAKQAISIIASPENSDPTAAIPSPGEPTSDTARVNMMTIDQLGEHHRQR